MKIYEWITAAEKGILILIAFLLFLALELRCSLSFKTVKLL
jgi:hypothetical protein